jgi:hypothetical protein
MFLTRRCSIARPGRGSLAALALLCTVGARSDGFATIAIEGADTLLRMVRVVPAITGGPTTVLLEADGPLPEPLSGALDGPPRVYLDLKGVRPRPDAVAATLDPLVRRTRVAVHSANPLVTRVVIDLTTAAAYRIDASGREQGRLVVTLEGPPRPSISPAIPVSGRRETSVPARSSKSAAASSAADQYLTRMSDVLIRLQALRPVLVSIDRLAESPPGGLEAAAVELEAIGRVLVAIRPPAAREPTHGLLVRACALGVRSSRMRQDSIRTNDTALVWNAASAAAGALMMLDRASSELRNP